MNLLAPIPSAALVALSSAGADGDDGMRTIVGVAIILVVLAVVISAGMLLDRAA